MAGEGAECGWHEASPAPHRRVPHGRASHRCVPHKRVSHNALLEHSQTKSQDLLE